MENVIFFYFFGKIRIFFFGFSGMEFLNFDRKMDFFLVSTGKREFLVLAENFNFRFWRKNGFFFVVLSVNEIFDFCGKIIFFGFSGKIEFFCFEGKI